MYIFCFDICNIPKLGSTYFFPSKSVTWLPLGQNLDFFSCFEKSSLPSGKEKLLEIREELGDQLVKESSRVIELEILVQKMQTEIAVLKGQVHITSYQRSLKIHR